MQIKYEHIKGVNPFLDQYIEQNSRLLSFYDYGSGPEDLKERAAELSERQFNRTELAGVLSAFNRRYTDCEETFRQIEKLTAENSAVIAGGQQAGIFTGPLYTVNKIISILTEAARAEDETGIPVVPVFWIAGEDHDIDEINHIFVHYRDEIKRVSVRERNDVKIAASERPVKNEETAERLLSSFRHLRETAFTGPLFEEWNRLLASSETYVDFFAALVHTLFKGTGIVLMDAHDPDIRHLEGPFFRELVRKNREIRSSFVSRAEAFREAGFGEPVTIDAALSHLFIHHKGERILLYASEDNGTFTDRDGRFSWTFSEVEQKAGSPGALSNNVVTRPLMQEWLLPVLGFVSGPGEIKYWGTLGEVFQNFDYKMPPLLPRMQITICDRRTQRYAGRLDADIHKVIANGVQKDKHEWQSARRPVDYSPVFERAESEMREVLQRLRNSLSENDLIPHKADTFEEGALNMLERYEKEVDREVKRDLAPGVTGYDSLSAALRPEGGLQERVINVLPFLNEYGPDLIRDLNCRIRENPPLSHEHTIVYL
ncbi:bacillithiol biosynthesis cysteine-adding enzyme BshC [Alteribacter natronophilus]|uniref:bacillithiol biosynthesis cysteine-adding enzyme BshC n=1 Tax=Alteribacter natronophilus TaxID=2583810 RepID=UPI00110F5737|nr:bacillithiol biosynthesis cysteine-adding enzyme BshC [Alteribacter natronophilus]TMW73116.1 bacillithiol biosynthesis cysteine-adding enzyme BshC [Alteribacter natronophilus]